MILEILLRRQYPVERMAHRKPLDEPQRSPTVLLRQVEQPIVRMTVVTKTCGEVLIELHILPCGAAHFKGGLLRIVKI